MKKMLACVLLLSLVAGNAHATKCFERQIKQLIVGSVSTNFGNDGGNAIYFYTDEMALRPIDNRYNMNDPQGPFMFKLLGMAGVGGNTVLGYDNWDGRCDKINQLTIIF